MSRDVRPNELPKAVKRLRLDDCFAASRTIVLDSEPLVIPEAAPLGESGQAGDIAAFWGPSDERVYCLEMSDATLVEGQSVWLVASLLEGAPADQRSITPKCWESTVARTCCISMTTLNSPSRRPAGPRSWIRLGDWWLSTWADLRMRGKSSGLETPWVDSANSWKQRRRKRHHGEDPENQAERRNQSKRLSRGGQEVQEGEITIGRLMQMCNVASTQFVRLLWVADFDPAGCDSVLGESPRGCGTSAK